ncbi:MAG: asparagine synthase (glutamine-hydrolyzing) [Clostridia bacterium]|nr:asparagine synthase (glutamine-hydrolyzing) [Clostridia bacterium]
MCGFAGFYDVKERFCYSGKETVSAMTEKIRHRGPDSDGVFSDSRYCVGFRRLRILDLKNGDQPFFSRCGRYVLAFNGEIYNHIELRILLKSRFGEKFQTECDTETLLYCCIHFGTEVLRYLRGMFAFAFYDREKKTLFCARDHFGIKPFYYGIFDSCFMFASEIKALLPHPLFKKEFNSDVLPLYLQFQYVPTEETAFSGVFRLGQGEYLLYDGKELKKERYFHPPVPSKRGYFEQSYFSSPRVFTRFRKDTDEMRDELLQTIESSVSLHTKCDVKYSTFLSGGVDSALITSIVRPGVCYSCGFKDKSFDETRYASRTADRLGSHLVSVSCDAENFFDSLSDVQYYADEPYANLSAVPLFLLSKRAAQDVTVILSGEGADELFGGYGLYQETPIKKIYSYFPRKLKGRIFQYREKYPERLKRFVETEQDRLESSYIGQARICSPSEACELLRPEYAKVVSPSAVTAEHFSKCVSASRLRKKMYLDLNLWLPFDILNKADKMTMAHSLELRVPYLDREVMKKSAAFSDGSILENGMTKAAFRRTALKKLDETTAMRPKKGFPVPFRNWIREEKYSRLLLDAFKSESCSRFFDTDKLIKLLSDHICEKGNHGRVLYTVYAFTVWYERYFNDDHERTKQHET